MASILYPGFPYLLRLAVFVAAYYGAWDQFSDNFRTKLRSVNQDESFDFIIVGSGSSGSVLAEKLSDHFKVLLLEAGGGSSPVSTIPISTFPMYWNLPEDWKYETVPQKAAAFGLINNITHWSAGKGLGGSSLINGMVYIRGTTQGFDIIAKQTGDPIWRLDNVIKYYKRIEDYGGYFPSAGVHGKGGKISVEKGYLSPYVKNLMRAGVELGYEVKDPNPDGPLPEGFAPMDLFTKNGFRWSAYHGYIKPILKRPSITIRKYAYVHKVILDENNVARGVEYLRHGKQYTATAKKEVILSAGAIQSPKILMLSGIGPKDDLEKLGIPVKVDLPVGQTLQDKYGAFVGPFIVDEGNALVISRDYSVRGIGEYIFKNTGPFSTSQADATFSILSKDAIAKGITTPDIHSYIMSVPMDKGLEKILYESSFNFKPEFAKKYFSLAYNKDAAIQLVSLNKPVGSGTLKLRDTNPTSNPLIDPKYLEDRRDVDTLVEGIKFAVKVMETKSMGEIHTKLIPRSIPGCEHEVFRSDAYWECLARHTTATAYKYCATAPMGKDTSDPIAVVDSRLRVFGVKGLRVIDASVLQERYVSVNHPTCTALGELAADFLLDEYGIEKTNYFRRRNL